MKLIYLFDPLCGWCYGAHPVLERLAQGNEVALAPTGLFAGEFARPMDARFAAYAWQNDQRIARLTGQPFAEPYRINVLGALGRMFDSAPATLGLVAVGLDSVADEWVALKALQFARYVAGRDTSDLEVVADVLQVNGFPAAAQRVRNRDEHLLQTYRGRIDAARQDMATCEAQGVPTLIAGEGPARRVISSDVLFDRSRDISATLAAA